MAKTPGNSNSSGFGVPGTQRTAQRNVAQGGQFNPYMPRQPQQARQSRSSYQQGLAGGQTPGRAAGRQGMPPRAAVPPMRKAPPSSGYELMAGLPHQDMMSMNRSMGLSAFSDLPGAAGGRPELPTVSLMGDQPLEQAPGGRRDGFSQPFGGFELFGDHGQTGRPREQEILQTFAAQEYEPPDVPWLQGWDGDSGDMSGDPGFVGGGEYTPPVDDGDGGGGWLPDGVGPGEGDGTTTQAQEEAATDSGVADGYVALGNAGVAISADSPGFEPAELEKAHTGIDDKALQGYNMGLSQLSRQYAMAGMSGSGSEIAANNALLAQVYGKALEEHRALDLANLSQIETDLQEKVTNWQQQGQSLMSAAQAGQQISTQQVQDWMNSVKFVNEEVVTSIMNMIDWTGHVPTGETLSALQNVMLGTQQMLASGASIEEVTKWAQEQLDIYGIGLHKPGWGEDDDYGLLDFAGDAGAFILGGPVGLGVKKIIED